MPTLAPLDYGAFIVAVAFLGDAPVFALGDGSLQFPAGGDRETKVHGDGLLAAVPTPDGSSVLTGGADGRVVRVDTAGAATELSVKPRKWIDLVVAGPQGAVAFASGRTAWVRLADGTEKEFQLARAVGGLAFAPKGMRLAVARYDGATLYWVNTGAPPQELTWKGAHGAATFSPDGKYLVTAMQENALHGWRLPDGQDMRMTGYPTKVKSMSWSAKGRYLATSGANAAIVWPFHGPRGPMGQQPLQLGPRSDAMVTAVACHPKEEVAAIGYSDGMVLMARFEDNAEVLLRRPGASPVSALAWDRAGERLAFGTEKGEAGIVGLAG